ncbi:MAG: thermonuclease family protein [Phycisphaerales bacterium]|nr:thermonuclease family protein [Phycisphaerales bacterium]
MLAALVALSAADRAGWLLADRPDGELYHLISARVLRVIDGDTIEVEIADHIYQTATTRVRLIGVDCPETAHPSFSNQPAQPLAEEAAALTRELVDGRVVRLRLEPQGTRDLYGRLLAHVDLPDGASLAERLLAEGLARREDRWNHSMLMRYRQLELAARRARRGVWQ